MNAPFQYGTLATKENFVDRVEDRAQLKNFLSSHINVMLVSPRRWGKSSLVKVAMEELQEEDKDVRVCYIDAFSIGSEAEFYKTFASQVTACADAQFVPKEQDKMDLLQLPEILAEALDVKIIVCISEFQQLANLPEYKDMEGKMRSVWQQQERVTYCLYGSKRHMMLDIFNNSNSPFYRFGQLLFLNKISKEKWKLFIVETFEKSGKHISDEFTSRICDTTECHSWYLQQCCYFVWNATAVEVTEESFNYGLKQMINTNSPMFQGDTEMLAASQVEMLRAIRDGVQQLSSAEARAKYHLGNPNTISKNKRILQNKDIVEMQDGRLVFLDPIYRLWFTKEYE